jgi:hypothetical protein
MLDLGLPLLNIILYKKEPLQIFSEAATYFFIFLIISSVEFSNCPLNKHIKGILFNR